MFIGLGMVVFMGKKREVFDFIYFLNVDSYEKKQQEFQEEELKGNEFFLLC